MDIAPLSLVINQPKVQQRSDIGVNESAIDIVASSGMNPSLCNLLSGGLCRKTKVRNLAIAR